MFFKLADRKKKEGEEFKPCEHNTCGLPDKDVIVQFCDVPTVEISYSFTSMEERTKAEIVAIIAAMNKKGKFVSKEWIQNVLNFKSRKADDLMRALKQENKIVELAAIRNARIRGTFYRLAGNKAKRMVQRVHAMMRRNKRAINKESFNSPKKGSPQTEKPFQNLNSSGVCEKINNEVGEAETHSEEKFQPLKKAGRGQSYRQHYPDGSAGDGLNGTCYSANGCMARLTNPEREEEYCLVAELLGATVDFTMTPGTARSIARRIDSGLITPENVAKIKNILEENKLTYTAFDLVIEFKTLLEKYTEKLIPEELWYFDNKINNLIFGSDSKQIIKDYTHASDLIKPLIQTYNNKPEVLTAKLSLVFDEDFVPAYAKLMCCYGLYISDDVISYLLNKFKNKIYRQLAENKAVYNFVKNKLPAGFVNWDEVDTLHMEIAGACKSTLYVNKLNHNVLNNYYTQLTFADLKKHGERAKCAELAAQHGTEAGAYTC